MRGWLAFWVAFGHLTYRKIYNEGAYDLGFGDSAHFGWLEDIIAFHFLAVDFFFILSGCLLYLLYRSTFEKKTKSWDIDRFLLLRVVRLYPMHVIGIALIGLYHALSIPHPLLFGQEGLVFKYWQTTLTLNLMMMHGWGIFPGAAWNAPTWTISLMLLLYTLFPNIVAGLKKLPDSTRANILGIAIVYLLYAALRNSIDNLSHSDGVGAIMRAIFFFFTGCFCARLYSLGWAKDWAWPKLLPAMIVAYAVAMILWFKWFHFPVFIFHLLYPLCMLGLLYCEGGIVSRFLTHKISFFLGYVSYSLYILHYPVLLLLKYGWGDTFAAWAGNYPLTLLLLYPMAIAAMILPAWLCAHYIELPITRWARRKLKGE